MSAVSTLHFPFYSARIVKTFIYSSLSQGLMLISHHGSHSHEVPVDVPIAGGICANHDGSVVMTLHRSGSIVAWSECSHAMLSDETTRFRPIFSKDCPPASTFTFISPKVAALACSDASITLWHIIDGKRGMSWKAHSSGVSIFLLTQGSPDGLELPGLFSFSRSGVGQVRLIRTQNNSQITHKLSISFGTSTMALFISRGRQQKCQSSLLVLYRLVYSQLLEPMPSSGTLGGRCFHRYPIYTCV
jgi:hypothetical protein